MSDFESHRNSLAGSPSHLQLHHTTHFKDPCPRPTVSHFLEAAVDLGMIKTFNDWSDAAGLRLVAP